MTFDLGDNTYYPLLQKQNISSLHIFYREQVVLFYYNLTRKSCDNEVQKMAFYLTSILSSLKKHLKRYPEFLIYLKMLYKMIGETRDCFFGKGEHDLTYMMIFVWYKYFPVLSIFALHRLVQPLNILSSNVLGYGSWRDIKYFCDYVRSHSPHGINDSLITISVELMNTQLRKDINIWGEILDENKKVSGELPLSFKCRERLSQVAKWIPREKKKFDWLNEKLVIHWFNTYEPDMLTSFNNYEGYFKAIKKCKMQYRKVIAYMNKDLDTTEIKFCSHQLKEVDYSNIPQLCMIKNKKRIYFDDSVVSTESRTFKPFSNDKYECSQNMKKFVKEKYDNDEPYESNNKTYTHLNISNDTPNGVPTEIQGQPLPIHRFKNIPNSGKLSYFIKEAFRLIETNDNFSISLLNNEWKKMSDIINLPTIDKCIPMLDMSFHNYNNIESFYSGIALACLIAERTSFGKRIMIIDNQPTWINLDDCNDLFSMIFMIYKTTKSNRYTSFNVLKCFELLIDSFIESNLSSSKIRRMNIVILHGGDPATFHIDSITKLFWQKGLTSSMQIPLLRPRIVYWNLSQTFIDKLPFEIQDNCILLSGLSSSLIYNLRFLRTSTFNGNSYQTLSRRECEVIKQKNIDSSFDFIYNILNKVYYDDLENYIDNIYSI
jgi:hypothetical protein